MSDEAYEPDESKVAVEDAAFIQSDGFEFDGIKMHGYSPERYWAADSIGLRYGRLTPEQNEQWKEDGTYPGMAGDVPVVLWVCHLENRGEWLSARRNPDVAMSKVEKFAMHHRIVSPVQDNWWKGYDIFLKIMRQIHQSWGETEKKTETVVVAQETLTTT
jgi:hypothetical protein